MLFGSLPFAGKHKDSMETTLPCHGLPTPVPAICLKNLNLFPCIDSGSVTQIRKGYDSTFKMLLFEFASFSKQCVAFLD